MSSGCFFFHLRCRINAALQGVIRLIMALILPFCSQTRLTLAYRRRRRRRRDIKRRAADSKIRRRKHIGQFSPAGIVNTEIGK
ncbi:hypothetical protein R3P38DRAFT_2866524 [Favolaschia claudopus]|uniref:Secreted protein n=1 Tax=Favolaschia claudopus TaxID=2862362 RepID=A0AAW0DHK3_9AGAR